MDNREHKRAGKQKIQNYQTNVEPHLEKIKEMRANGMTEKQCAEQLHVAYSTFREYKQEHPALTAVLKLGEDYAIELVENALYESALGGNLGAQIFFLKNRAPHKWRDKQEIDHNVQGSLSIKQIEERQESGLSKFFGGK